MFRPLTSPESYNIRVKQQVTALGVERPSRVYLSASLAENLETVARRERVSVWELLAAAFEILLFRYTRGDSALNIRLVVTGPTAEGNSEDFGFNYVADLSPELTLSETIRQVSKKLRGTDGRRGLPEALGAEPGSRVLTLSWYQAEASANLLNNSSWIRLTCGITQGIWIDIAAGTLFGNTRPVIRVADHIQSAIRALVEPPGSAIASLPLLDESEKFTLLEDWSGINRGGAEVSDCCLHSLFEETVASFPDRIAIQYGDEKCTYAELNAKANQLARFLRDKGVGPGDFVGILLRRSPSLYVSLLGVLKSGAAYVPMDPEYPVDRVRYIANDCGIKVLLSDSTVGTADQFPCDVIHLDTIRESQISVLPDSNLDAQVRPSDVAYVIYTSGTTGNPKGVQIEHQSVSQLVQLEGTLFNVSPQDRVYQGFSIAFDASVEEVWLAFHSGATLVPATPEMSTAGPALAGMLTKAGVTVFSTVPTLLSMLEEEMPSVHLLILGGEQCPKDLVTRWVKPGRRLINSYGPTEATVIATFTECDPHVPVTIGRSLPGYLVYILDPAMQPVPIGVPGELHIGGKCLSRGYVGLPELTARKFVPNPFSDADSFAPKLYKTGDLVRFNEAGEIEFLGRIDTQVKLRGFRIELSEIESVLLEVPGVQAAAVALREDSSGIKRLVGYVVPARGAELDENVIKTRLRLRLAHYMVPSFIEKLDELPTLPSGKVNRENLPAPRVRAAADRNLVPARTEIEKKIGEVWGRLFHPIPVSIEDDFFELGGHSLLAARLVSELRKDPSMSRLSVPDVYHCRTLEKIALCVEEDDASKNESDATEESPSTARFTFLSGVMQAAALFTVFGIASIYLLLPLLSLRQSFDQNSGPLAMLVGLSIAALEAFAIVTTIAIAAKWTLIGRYREGTFPLWGAYYWRFWLVRHIGALVPVGYAKGTPLLAIYMRIFGAKIGPGVYLGTTHFCVSDLTTIGEGASVGTDAQLLGYKIEDGVLRIGRISVGEHAYVGSKAVIEPGTSVGSDASLDAMSMLSAGRHIPDGEVWRGSPAKVVSEESHRGKVEPIAGPAKRVLAGLAHLISYIALGFVPFVAALPGLYLYWRLYLTKGFYVGFTAVPALSALYVICLCAVIAALKWILLGKIRPGAYPIQSFFYLRKWTVDALMQMSLELLHPLYATIYLPPWFRLLGAKLDKRVEISTAAHISPDLLTIGRESFIADSASLGTPHVDRGHINVAAVEVGSRTFVGNSAYVPIRSRLADSTLVGCLSVPPTSVSDMEKSGASWLGSPAIFLPRRQKSAEFPAKNTFAPPVSLYLIRGFIESFRVTLPATIGAAAILIVMGIWFRLGSAIGIVGASLLLPMTGLVIAIATCLVVILLKWIIMGRYTPTERPLWSHFVWRTELVTALHESLSVPLLLNALQGTTLMAWYFRLMGSRIGKNVCMETTQLTEFDLVNIGDDACLGLFSTVQTHLFEDRVMKMSHLRIGPRCSVGSFSVVLYDSEMGSGSKLGSLSLLMKGESLPENTVWQGSPARRAK